ncbi:MAG: hypothetical protein AAGE52_38900 [Myxococcota bacterium]
MKWWCVLLVACGATPAPRTTVEVPEDPVAAALTRAGLQPTEVAGHGFLATEERMRTRVALPAGCVAFVTKTSAPLRDLDAALYAPDGTLLAEDVEPDPHPTLRRCGEAQEAYLVLAAYDGAGRFEYAMWTGAESSMDAVAEAVGSAPPMRVDAPRRFLEGEEALRRRGFSTLQDERSIRVVGEVRFPVARARGRCVAVIAAANRGGVTLRLESEGSAIEEATGSTTAVQQCGGDSPATAILRADEETTARVRVLSGESENIGGEQALWLGEETPRIAAPSDHGRAVRDAGEINARAGAMVNFPAEGCGRFQAWVVEGHAELELRSSRRSRGNIAEAESCEAVQLVTDAPARIRWRWLAPLVDGPS